MDFRKILLKKSPVLFYAATSVFAAGVFFPKSATMPEVRMPIRALKIEVSRTSPAYAALLDIRSDYKQQPSIETKTLQIASTETLRAGVVHKARPASAQVVVAETVRRLNALQVNVEEQVVHAPTAVEAAQNLVNEELRNRELASAQVTGRIRDQRHLTTQRGGSIVVSRLEKSSGAAQRAPANTYASNNNGAINRNPFSRSPSRAIEVRAPKSRPAPSRSSGGSSNEVTIASNDSNKSKSDASMSFASASAGLTNEVQTGRISIRGPIQFVNGMAYSPGLDQIFIYQEYSTAQLSRGEFYFNQGQYQIAVEEPRGRIVAEVRSRDGQLIGRGTIAVRDLAERMKSKSIINDLSIQVSPAESALTGEVVAASSAFKHSLAVPEARITIADLNREIIREPKSKAFVDKEFRLGSQVMVRAQAPGHWSSQILAESGSPFQLGLFSNSTMTALLSLASTNKFSARDAETGAVIWGRLTVNGQPVADAKVELMTNAAIQPTYFNGMIPDRTLLKTSTNGEFVFVGVPGGVQYIQATINGEKHLPFVVFAEEKSVAQVDYALQTKRIIEFGVFNGEDASRFQPFRIQFVGVETHQDMLAANPQKMSVIVPRAGLTMAEFDPGVEYQQTRAMLSGTENEVLVPAFKNEWASGFGENLIVGDVGGDGYTVVVMDHSGTVQQNNVNVVYLDEKNQPTDKNYGEDGQRYVVKGLNPGFYTIVIVPTNSKDVLTDIVYVDAEAITYTKKTISDF